MVRVPRSKSEKEDTREGEYKAYKEGKRNEPSHIGRHKRKEKHKGKTVLEKVEMVEGTCECMVFDSADATAGLAGSTRSGICVEKEQIAVIESTK